MQIALSAFVALLSWASFAWQAPAQKSVRPDTTLVAAPDAPLDADPARPAAVETAEVPVIPSEVFERMRQYQDVRTATFQGWSPDGAGMLVATRFGNTNQLHRVYTPGGRREQITFFPEPRLRQNSAR